MAETGIQWSGLLRWSLQYTDGTSDTRKRLSEEDRQFLENAIKGYLANVEDPDKVVRESAIKLKNELSKEIRDHDVLTGEACVILQCVDDHAEIARNLHNLDAITPLLEIVSTWEQMPEEAVISSLQLFASALQNNPKLQQTVGSLRGVDIFTKLSQAGASDDLRFRALSALSSLIRNQRNLQKVFENLGGVQHLIENTSSPILRIRQKSASLLSSLIVDEVINSSNAVLLPQALINLIKTRSMGEAGGLQHAEIINSLTLVALRNFRPQFAKTGDLDLIQEAAEERLEYMKGLMDSEEYKEETEGVNEILKLCRFPRKK